MTSLVEALKAKGLWLATAESLTGGLLADAIIREPGASNVFLGGVIAYQDQIKAELLGVSSQLLNSNTAVDAQVVTQMASGVRQRLAQAAANNVDEVIGISTTGVAGPLDLMNHEVGEVFIGISSLHGSSSSRHLFEGDRLDIREASVQAAIAALREEIAKF